jgi:Response regulators consisting of a CheY-like receiver domain and a winged-helix DNA-binding domain
MRALIRRSSGIATSVLLVKEVEIDFRARSVRYMNEESMLTAKEFSLLEYLVLKRGKVISRMELYEHLFDEIDESYSNVLDVYVSNLRKKIRPDLIETRRGMGYVIP